jgi:hypothetical protein
MKFIFVPIHVMLDLPVPCKSDESSASSSSTILCGVARAENDFFIVETRLECAFQNLQRMEVVRDALRQVPNFEDA